jgi:hypothetical protein
MTHPFARHEPDDDHDPIPLESGQLGPPRRKPPTAVGVATPRGPRHSSRPSRYRTPALRLVSIAILGVLIFALGITISIVATGAAKLWGLGVLAWEIAFGYHVIVHVRYVKRFRGPSRRRSRKT